MAERTNLKDEHPHVAAELTHAAEAWRAALERSYRPDLLALAPLVYRFAVLRRFPLPRSDLRQLYPDTITNDRGYLKEVMQSLLKAAGRMC